MLCLPCSVHRYRRVRAAVQAGQCRPERAEFEIALTTLERLPRKAGEARRTELQTALRDAGKKLRAAGDALQPTKKGTLQ